jgi:arsenate reductase
MPGQDFDMTKVYAYKGCDSCRRAIKWLRGRGVEFEEVAIRETPPGLEELTQMHASFGGDLRALFNTSGKDYRELGLKDRIRDMGFDEAAALLSENGNLVKRPFVVGDGIGLAGFKEDEWSKAFGLQ